MASKFPASAEQYSATRNPTIAHFEIGYDSADQTFTVPVKAGMFVHSVGLRVITAFDGTGVALNVGDGDDTVGYIATADITFTPAPAVGAAQVIHSDDAAQDYARGKYYTADDTIDFAWTQGTTATTGLLKGFVILSYVANDGLATGTTAS